VSNHICDKLRGLGAPEEKIRLLHGGIRLSKFEFDPPSPRFDGETVRCLHVGRLVEKKAPLDLVRAFSEARHRVGDEVDLQLTIAGDGPKADQKEWRKKLQRAYQETTYGAAKERLTDLHAEIQQINRRAARSLQEGLEETLTLHRLGLFDELGKSLKTTNCIESLMGELEGYIGDVKRWHHSPQRHQWMALGLLESEGGFRRLDGYRNLSRLKRALKEAIPDHTIPDRK
jgi:glycosyltransferase involved in cell wall biosynthesis